MIINLGEDQFAIPLESFPIKYGDTFTLGDVGDEYGVEYIYSDELNEYYPARNTPNVEIPFLIQLTKAVNLAMDTIR